jgi:hypothetical protein
MPRRPGTPARTTPDFIFKNFRKTLKILLTIFQEAVIIRAARRLPGGFGALQERPRRRTDARPIGGSLHAAGGLPCVGRSALYAAAGYRLSWCTGAISRRIAG